MRIRNGAEKTAVLQDAQLDWRKLMNLQNPQCAMAIRPVISTWRSASTGMASISRNSTSSLWRARQPGPVYAHERECAVAVQAEGGSDPIDIWNGRHRRESLRQFLDFRADLARRMQEEWLSAAEKWKPGLDLVLTHVDDRFDTGMRDSIGRGCRARAAAAGDAQLLLPDRRSRDGMESGTAALSKSPRAISL